MILLNSFQLNFVHFVRKKSVSLHKLAQLPVHLLDPLQCIIQKSIAKHLEEKLQKNRNIITTKKNGISTRHNFPPSIAFRLTKSLNYNPSSVQPNKPDLFPYTGGPESYLGPPLQNPAKQIPHPQGLAGNGRAGQAGSTRATQPAQGQGGVGLVVEVSLQLLGPGQQGAVQVAGGQSQHVAQEGAGQEARVAPPSRLRWPTECKKKKLRKIYSN